MRFTKDLLLELKDSGKNVCVFSEKLSQYLEVYHYDYFEEFSSRLYYYWIKGKKAIPLKVLFEVMQDRKISTIDIGSFSVGGGNRIYPPNEQDQFFYYFLGLILGDGCLIHSKRGENKNTYLIQISFRKKEEANLIKDLADNFFNVCSAIYMGKGCYNLCIHSKPLVLILHKKYQIPLGLKYNFLIIPKIIKESNIKIIKKFFLKGIFDSDGNIYLHRGRKCVQLRQKSEKFIRELQDLLNDVGISFNNPYFDKANNSWVLWSSKKFLVDSFISKIDNLGLRAPVAQPG